MTIKATSLLALIAVWACMIPAIIAQPDAWWSLVFAALATAAIGVSAWRRLGISRLIAITGVWLGTAIAVGTEPDAAWIAVFSFLSTAAIVYSTMRRAAWLPGLGVAVPWVLVGSVIAANEESGAWISVFAFLTAVSIAHSGEKGSLRGASAILWWAIAAAVMLIADGGWTYALSVAAFLLTAATIGLSDFSLPKSFEWDLFERDDEEQPKGPVRYH